MKNIKLSNITSYNHKAESNGAALVTDFTKKIIIENSSFKNCSAG